MDTRTIVINPVTRIEGHGKVTIFLDEQGQVSDTHFQVTDFRGFEKLAEGRPYYEMPALTARSCGICPVSHLMASAKACDQIMAVRIPETAVKLRKLMNLAQMVQSHALSFFHLSSPDLLLGMDSDPAQRNIFGLMQKYPDLARDGIRLRKYGQSIIEWLGGKRVHPAWVVPGGVSAPLTPDVRDRISAGWLEAMSIAQRTLDWFKHNLDRYREEARTFGNFPTLFMGLVALDGSGELEHYHGRLRFTDANGAVIADEVDPTRYMDYIGEAVEPYSYLKSPYYKPMGYPGGIYRVGPLARLNIIDRCGTPKADQEWAEFRSIDRRAVLSSFYYHYARLIEIVYSLEKILELVNDPHILDKQVRASAGVNCLEGIGISEAPRGTLFHHYQVDEHGMIRNVNMIIATGNNNLALNRSVLQVAKHYVRSDRLTEGMLNRVEAVIRAYDPCLSCSTHAFGDMPLHVRLVGPDGAVLDELRRG
jgi:NAD-reducing hydrogenase large subunit